MRTHYSSIQGFIAPILLFFILMLTACSNQGDSVSSTAPDSFDGIKWETPYVEVFKMCEQQRSGKVSPFGKKVIMASSGGSHGILTSTYYNIELINYVYEGVPGSMTYLFTPDSTDKNHKPPRFESAIFLFERENISTSSDVDQSSPEAANNYYLQQAHINYLKLKKWHDKLESLFTTKYGKPEVSDFNTKTWKWAGSCLLELYIPPDSLYNGAAATRVQISINPRETKP